MAVAELMHAVAVEIEDAPPVDVDQSCALGPHDLRQARRRQRLAQEIALILIESVARPLAQGLPPSGARWRDVDVAFAEQHSAVFHLTRARAGIRGRGHRQRRLLWRGTGFIACLLRRRSRATP